MFISYDIREANDSKKKLVKEQPTEKPSLRNDRLNLIHILNPHPAISGLSSQLVACPFRWRRTRFRSRSRGRSRNSRKITNEDSLRGIYRAQLCTIPKQLVRQYTVSMYGFEHEMSMERTWDEHRYAAVSRENFEGQRMDIVNCVLLATT